MISPSNKSSEVPWTREMLHVKRLFGLPCYLMDRLHYGQNFERSLNRKTYYPSIEEHPKISKIAKFGCETL